MAQELKLNGYDIAPDIADKDLRIDMLVRCFFDEEVVPCFIRTHEETPLYTVEGYDRENWCESKTTHWVQTETTVDKTPGFLRGFPVVRGPEGVNTTCVELFFDYEDIYSSSLVIPLRNVRAMYRMPSIVELFTKRLHQSWTGAVHGMSLCVRDGRTGQYHTIQEQVDTQVLGNFIANNDDPMIRIFDHDENHASRPAHYYVASQTGLMLIKRGNSL